MITCKLGDKEYSVDHVNLRALYEIQPVMVAFARVLATIGAVENGTPLPVTDGIQAEMGIFARWFCLLFEDQFTPDDLYDHYPANRFMVDITLALLAINTSHTEMLTSFPTK